MNSNNYIVSFMPGSRGRLIASIIYKLISSDSTPIIFTEFNSAHNGTNNWIFDVNKIQNILHDKKSVYCTHIYPNWDTKIFNTVFINVPTVKLHEVCLNAAIKNVISKIEFLQNGGSLDETQKKFMRVYERFLPKNYTDILYDDQKLKTFLQSIQTSYIPNIKFFYKRFIDHTMNDNNVFQINYQTMFDKTNNKYIILNRLTTWLNVEYTSEMHDTVEQYDLDKYKIFEKYCPWLKEEVKW